MNFTGGLNSSVDWEWPFNETITPHIVMSSIYMVIGVIGNSIVLAVYRYQMKKTSNERYFIPILAVLDLIASIVCSLATIIWDLMQTNFENVILCKCIYLFTPFIGSMSFCFLLCIAVQRYLKICRNYTLSLQFRRMMIMFSILFSMVICSPFGVNYGINIYKKNGNIEGKRCDRLRNRDFYISGLSFAIAFAVYVFFVVLALFILYGMVGWKVLNHIRVKKPTLSSTSANKMEQLENEDTCNTIMGETTSDNQMISDVKDGKRKNKDSSRRTVEDENHKEKEMMVPSDITKSMLSIKENHCVLECKGYEASADTVCPPSNPFATARPIPYSQPIRHNSNESRVVESPEDCRLPSYPSNEDNHLSKTPVACYEQCNQRTKRVKLNFSLMFIAITLVAIICYCPIGAVVLLEGIFPDFWENFTSTESHVILWFYRTFIINSIINPFLYACLDTEFYNGCKRLFRKLTIH